MHPSLLAAFSLFLGIFAGTYVIPNNATFANTKIDAPASETTSEHSEYLTEKSSVEKTEEKESVPVAEVSKDVFDLEKYKVSSMADLEKGKFYVQIAMLGDESNIRATIGKYGKQYPITLVPLSNGKGYQFLIGSLTMDEYGTVLNRFRSYGYKDAFLRKIK